MDEDLKNLIVKVAIVGVVILAIGALFGLYRINTGQGAILTQVDGQRVPVTEVGWHWRAPLFTGLNTYSIVNNRMYFPADYPQLEEKWQADKQTGSIGFDINTPDNKVVDTAGMVTFQIVDLVQFGVMNTEPVEMLQKQVDAEFFKTLQSDNYPSDSIIHNQNKVNVDLLVALRSSGLEKQYGISFNSVQLIRPTYTHEALQALSKKQAMLSISEGELLAAEKKADAIRTMAKAEKDKADMLRGTSVDILNYNVQIETLTALKELKDKQGFVWVVPYGQPLVIQK